MRNQKHQRFSSALNSVEHREEPPVFCSLLRLADFCLCLLGILLSRTLGCLGFFASCSASRLLRSLFLELLNTTRRIDKLLLTRVEWVARGTQFNVNVIHRRTSLELITTCANNRCVWVVGWVEIGLHNAEKAIRKRLEKQVFRFTTK